MIKKRKKEMRLKNYIRDCACARRAGRRAPHDAGRWALGAGRPGRAPRPRTGDHAVRLAERLLAGADERAVVGDVRLGRRLEVLQARHGRVGAVLLRRQLQDALGLADDVGGAPAARRRARQVVPCRRSAMAPSRCNSARFSAGVRQPVRVCASCAPMCLGSTSAHLGRRTTPRGEPSGAARAARYAVHSCASQTTP